MRTHKQRWQRQVKCIREDSASAATAPGGCSSQTYCGYALDVFHPLVGIFLPSLSPAVQSEGVQVDSYAMISGPTSHVTASQGANRNLTSGASPIQYADKEFPLESAADRHTIGTPAGAAALNPPKGIPRLRSALSMGDLLSAGRPKDARRHMRFSSTVHVCLVPTRAELLHIVDELYFRADDFAAFKQDAVLELREVLTRLGLSSKQAINLMYQPQPDEGANAGALHLQLHHPAVDEVEGPSLSDDESDAVRSPRHGDALEISSIPTEVEGPSLSDDEDEAEAYRATVDSNLRAAAFITGIKTDVELNAKAAVAVGAGESPAKFSKSIGSSRVLPSHTPSGANAEAHATWQVQWKGPAATNLVEIQKPSLRMRKKLLVKE